MVVILITIPAIASIAIFGVTQSFDVRQFEPNSEAVKALDLISQDFQNQGMVTVLVEFICNDVTFDNLNQSQFLKVLELEKSIFEDEGINPYLYDSQDFRQSIYSPISGMVLVMMNIITAPNSTLARDWQNWSLTMIPAINSITGEPLLDSESGDPLFVPAQTYDNLIITIRNIFTMHIHLAIYLMMAEGSGLPLAARDGLLGLMSNDFTFDTPIKSNASAGLILVNYKNNGEAGNVSRLFMEQKILELTNDVEGGGIIRTHVVGWGLVNKEISRSAVENLFVLFPVAILLILFFLYWFQRDLWDVFITASSLIIAIVWVYGLAAWIGEVLTPLSLAVPFLILGIGTDYSVHLIVRYRQEREEGRNKEESSLSTLRIVGPALVLSMVTTCTAYFSNVTSDMQGMIQFGLMNALGLLSAFFIIMLLVPSYLRLRSKDVHRSRLKPHISGVMQKVLDKVAKTAYSKGKVIIAAVAIITICMGLAATNITVDFDAYEFLPRGSDIGEAVHLLDDNFQATGIYEVTILIEGKAYDPELLMALQTGMVNMATVDNVVIYGSAAATRSMFDVWHDWALFDGIEDVRFNSSFQALYANYFTYNQTSSIFTGATATELEDMLEILYANESARTELSRYIFVSGDGGYVKVNLAIMDALTEGDVRLLETDLYLSLSPVLDAGYPIIITGDIIVSYEIVDVMREAQLQSVIITLGSACLILTIIGIIRYRSITAGLLMVIPTSITIVWLWGASYLMGLTLNPLTMTVAAIAVGVGVDYAIHMANRFFDLTGVGMDVQAAITDTVTNTGKGVFGGAVTTAIGFGILGFFSMSPIAEFGILAMFSILISLAITMLFLSSALVWWGEKRFNS